MTYISGPITNADPVKQQENLDAFFVAAEKLKHEAHQAYLKAKREIHAGCTI